MNRPLSNEFSRYYEPIQQGQVRGMRPKQGINIKRRKKTGARSKKAGRKKVQTFTTHRERAGRRRPSVAQTASDFMSSHQQSLMNQIRDTTIETRLQIENKKQLALEDRKQTSEALLLKQAELEDRQDERRLKQLEDQRRHDIQLDNNRRQDRIAMESISLQRNQQRLMEGLINQYAGRMGQQERRTGELEQQINQGVRRLENKTQQPIPINILRQAPADDTDFHDIAPPRQYSISQGKRLVGRQVSAPARISTARTLRSEETLPQEQINETRKKIQAAQGLAKQRSDEGKLPRQSSLKELAEKDATPHGLKPPTTTKLRPRRAGAPPPEQRPLILQQHPADAQNIINQRERARRQGEKPTEDPTLRRDQRRSRREEARVGTGGLAYETQTITIRESEPEEQKIPFSQQRQESEEYTPRTLKIVREGTPPEFVPTKPTPTKAQTQGDAPQRRRPTRAAGTAPRVAAAVQRIEALTMLEALESAERPRIPPRDYSPEPPKTGKPTPRIPQRRVDGGAGVGFEPEPEQPVRSRADLLAEKLKFSHSLGSSLRKQQSIADRRRMAGLREPEPEPEPLRPDVAQQRKIQSRLEEFDRLIGKNRNKTSKLPNQKVSVKLEILRDLDHRELGGKGNIPITRGSYPLRNYGAGQAPSDNARRFLFYKDFYNDVKVARKVSKVEGGQLRQVPKIEGKDFALDLYGREDYFRRAIVDGKIKFTYIDPNDDESYIGEIIH